MIKKIILLVATCFALAVCFSIGVSANTISPFWGETNTYQIFLNYSGSSASCEVRVVGATGTTRIDSCNVTLKNSNGSTVQSWSNQWANGDELNFYQTASSVSKGSTYTLSFSANVHRNGKTEPISGSLTKTY